MENWNKCSQWRWKWRLLSLRYKLHEAGISDCFISDGAQAREQSLEQKKCWVHTCWMADEWMNEWSRIDGDPKNLEIWVLASHSEIGD